MDSAASDAPEGVPTDVFTRLTEWKLQKYAQALCSSFGIVEEEELSQVSMDDLKELGMTRIEIRRFFKSMSNQFGLAYSDDQFSSARSAVTSYAPSRAHSMAATSLFGDGESVLSEDGSAAASPMHGRRGMAATANGADSSRNSRAESTASAVASVVAAARTAAAAVTLNSQSRSPAPSLSSTLANGPYASPSSSLRIRAGAGTAIGTAAGTASISSSPRAAASNASAAHSSEMQRSSDAAHASDRTSPVLQPRALQPSSSLSSVIPGPPEDFHSAVSCSPAVHTLTKEVPNVSVPGGSLGTDADEDAEEALDSLTVVAHGPPILRVRTQIEPTKGGHEKVQITMYRASPSGFTSPASTSPQGSPSQRTRAAPPAPSPLQPQPTAAPTSYSPSSSMRSSVSSSPRVSRSRSGSGGGNAPQGSTNSKASNLSSRRARPASNGERSSDADAPTQGAIIATLPEGDGQLEHGHTADVPFSYTVIAPGSGKDCMRMTASPASSTKAAGRSMAPHAASPKVSGSGSQGEGLKLSDIQTLGNIISTAEKRTSATLSSAPSDGKEQKNAPNRPQTKHVYFVLPKTRPPSAASQMGQGQMGQGQLAGQLQHLRLEQQWQQQQQQQQQHEGHVEMPSASASSTQAEATPIALPSGQHQQQPHADAMPGPSDHHHHHQQQQQLCLPVRMPPAHSEHHQQQHPYVSTTHAPSEQQQQQQQQLPFTTDGWFGFKLATRLMSGASGGSCASSSNGRNGLSPCGHSLNPSSSLVASRTDLYEASTELHVSGSTLGSVPEAGSPSCVVASPRDLYCMDSVAGTKPSSYSTDSSSNRNDAFGHSINSNSTYSTNSNTNNTSSNTNNTSSSTNNTNSTNSNSNRNSSGGNNTANSNGSSTATHTGSHSNKNSTDSHTDRGAVGPHGYWDIGDRRTGVKDVTSTHAADESSTGVVGDSATVDAGVDAAEPRCLQGELPCEREGAAPSYDVAGASASSELQAVHEALETAAAEEEGTLRASNLKAASHTEAPIIQQVDSMQDSNGHEYGVVSIPEDVAAKLNAVLEGTLDGLDLCGRNLGGAGAATIAAVLEAAQGLSKLRLDLCALCDSGCPSLAQGIKANQNVETMSLGANAIEDAGMAHLAAAIEDHASLSKLHLWNNLITRLGAESLGKVLKANSNVTVLNLRANLMGDAGCAALLLGLQSSRSLSWLSLSSNSMGRVACKVLGAWLKRPTCTLKSLYAGENRIEDQGAEYIAEGLSENRSLETCDLHSNSIGPEGARALAESLKLNSHLSSLDLSHNRIGRSGAMDLAAALPTNSSLTYVNLWNNGIKDEGRQALDTVRRLKAENDELDGPKLEPDTSTSTSTNAGRRAGQRSSVNTASKSTFDTGKLKLHYLY